MSLRVPDPYNGPVVLGLDVSVYQANVDWHRVAAAKREFSIARCAYGVHEDERFHGHYTSARAAGLVPGSYLYFRPAQDPLEQAKHAADLVGPIVQPGDLPIAIDIERAEGLDPQRIEDRAMACIAQLEADGLKAMVYAGAFVAQFVAMDKLGALPLWTPWYDASSPVHIPKGWQHWTFHQTSSTARVDGVMTWNGKPALCDADEFRGDRAAFDLFRGVVP